MAKKSLWDELRQYISDAMPGGALNPEVTKQSLLDGAATALTPVPVVGDVAGLLSDVHRYKTEPESRTLGNYALSGLGLLPFVPSMAGVIHGGKIADALNAVHGDKIDAFIGESGSNINLNKIVAKNKNSGDGTAFMQDFIKAVDEDGRLAALTASSDFGGNKKRLEEFYKRFGFVSNKGKNKDYSISEGMYRLPSEKLGATDTAFEGPRSEAFRIAQANAAKPVSEGGLGLRPDNTPMERARAMGFDMDVYHGSNDISKTEAFDPLKTVDNVQYGGKFYSSTDPEYASKYAQNSLLGDSQGVFPLMMRSGKRFDMQAPVQADDAANIMEQLGQYERADKIRSSGKPYRNGNELFYWGLGSDIPNSTKGDAILRSGFDSIHGDPKFEIVGEAGKPHSVVSDPSRLRSRFAAFDPARRHEADLLGFADPRLLALIAAGTGGGLLATQD